MRGRRETRLAPIALVLAGLLASLVLPYAGGADPSAQTLHARQTSLGSRAHAALLSLYSLDSRLEQSRQRLIALRAQARALRVELREVAREEAIAHRAWRVSIEALGARLRILYEQGQPDAMGVLLGATSIDDAVTRLDDLRRTATLNRETIAQARRAHLSLTRFQLRLEARARTLHRLVSAAERATSALATAHAERTAYIHSLSRERRFTARQIMQLDSRAHASAARSPIDATAATPPLSDAGSATTAAPPVLPSIPPPSSSNTRTVTATGYSLDGHTSTGVPVGWGVVAVDPAVIPLGTRLTIPGYGEGVAADTGDAIQGSTIDLWFPSEAQARAWGRRTITIALH